ncbi:MAG: hypothetical protein WC030_02005 [Candidatus Paceibacterota bacterium]
MKNARGSVLILTLVFGSIFFMLLTSLASFVLAENRAQDALIGRAEAFSIAEAGLNYYAWFLSRFPTDFQNGTGAPGPYELSYADPENTVAGSYTLDIVGSSACGSTQTVTITSTGVSNNFPSTSSTLVARYGAPTVASYATLLNNGTVPITTPDLAALSAAASAYGILLPRHAEPEDPHTGYHLVFNSDGTVSIYYASVITTLRSVRQADGTSSGVDYTLISSAPDSETLYQTVNLSTTCGLIFSETNVWIEGVIPSKVTVVAANQTGSGADVILRNNITYALNDGSVGLTVIAEHNILIAPDAPMNLELNGIFVALNGIFGRNNYYTPSRGCTGLYEPRGTLTIKGSVVSKLTPKTLWVNGCFGSDSGYLSRTISTDPGNAVNPPPFTPTTSAVRQFIDWQQIR